MSGECVCDLCTLDSKLASDAACAVTPDGATNIAIHFLPLGLGSGFLHGQIQAQGLTKQVSSQLGVRHSCIHVVCIVSMPYIQYANTAFDFSM